MGITYTEDQKKVIDTRNHSLLVSAAAGSGKTAVLVERIIQQICDSNAPIDIDRFLVVTFTRAAAAQMRDKISQALNKKLAEDPENEHLQRQASLVHHAQITTIDSFCMFILKNNFHDIGLDPSFRIADEGEMKLLWKDTVAEVLEECYANGDEKFLFMAECLAKGSRDKELEEQILKLYKHAMSDPWPERWIERHSHDYEIPNAEWNQCDWYRLGLVQVEQIMTGIVKRAQENERICELPSGPYMYGEMITAEREQLERVADMIRKSGEYSSVQSALNQVKFGTLSSKKDDTVNPLYRTAVKSKRDRIKKDLKKLTEYYFAHTEENVLEQCRVCDAVIKSLCEVTLLFMQRLAEKKRIANILDFQDAEHMALNIMISVDEQGNVLPTTTAMEYRGHFAQIMIDEYQDSNLVQEYLLWSICGEENGNYNRFMVGDVKQSIYKFRLAKPEIFMDKYKTYREAKQCMVIDLHQNFRSRKQVLDTVNGVFEQLMGPGLGGLDYDDKAALYLGAEYPDPEQEVYKSELLIYPEDSENELNKLEQEAYSIGVRIQELMQDFEVKSDKEEGQTRKLAYGDIVILLRSMSGYDEILPKVLTEMNIPVYMTNHTGYFKTYEIRTLLHYLRIVSNPLQDIPFYGVMHSCIGDFTDQEIAIIRANADASMHLYEACKAYASANVCKDSAEDTGKEVATDSGKDAAPVFDDGTIAYNPELATKAKKFLETLQQVRSASTYMPLHELLQYILKITDYRDYICAMPGGGQRQANLDMLLYKAADFEKTSFYGLHHFVQYMEQLERYEVDYGEAVILDENADVVRVMTIHKSKGLEFPVCFVAGLSKQFNLRDTSASMLLDADVGIAVEAIDPVARTKKHTLRRKIVADKMKSDSLAEELRVLYVAMTRAKEKLIMTGFVKHPEKKLQSIYQDILHDGKKIEPCVLLAADSYMDWMLMALIRNKCMDELLKEQGLEIDQNHPVYQLDFQIYPRIVALEYVQMAELAEDTRREVLYQSLMDSPDEKEMIDALRQKMDYEYPYKELHGLPVKTSVSELKIASMQETDEEAYEQFENPEKEPYVPAFARKQEGMSGASRGTAYHRFMELFDFVKAYKVLTGMAQDGDQNTSFTKAASTLVGEELVRMGQEKLLYPEYEAVISDYKIVRFLQSDLAKRMTAAASRQELRKEQPFVIGVGANLLDSKYPKEETVLIQGIIDVFWREGDGYILMDYKTDRVDSAEELIGRYKTQLDYYKEALKRQGYPVIEAWMYSFALGKAILVPMD